MKNRSDKDDIDQSVDHQNIEKQETPEDQPELSLHEQLSSITRGSIKKLG